jgi:hypothetical protein
MRWDHISELRPPTGLLFISQMTYMSMERRWNDIDRGKRKNSEENLSQSHYVYNKPHMDWLGREPGPAWWETGN